MFDHEGLSKEFEVIITESLVNDFTKISGDYSPIHMDEEYAKSTTFEKRVVHGMLLASFLSRVDGMYLPGKHALYFSQTVEFRNPCFIGDKVTVFSKVIDKSDSTKILKTYNKKKSARCQSNWSESRRKNKPFILILINPLPLILFFFEQRL